MQKYCLGGNHFQEKMAGLFVCNCGASQIGRQISKRSTTFMGSLYIHFIFLPFFQECLGNIHSAVLFCVIPIATPPASFIAECGFKTGLAQHNYKTMNY